VAVGGDNSGTWMGSSSGSGSGALASLQLWTKQSYKLTSLQV